MSPQAVTAPEGARTESAHGSQIHRRVASLVMQLGHLHIAMEHQLRVIFRQIRPFNCDENGPQSDYVRQGLHRSQAQEREDQS